MELDPEPDSLTCAECGTTVAESGYLPATEVGEETYEPLPDMAVCGTCGFNELGFAGCAPEFGDLADPGSADTLLQIAVSDMGVDVLGAKD